MFSSCLLRLLHTLCVVNAQIIRIVNTHFVSVSLDQSTGQGRSSVIHLHLLFCSDDFTRVVMHKTYRYCLRAQNLADEKRPTFKRFRVFSPEAFDTKFVFSVWLKLRHAECHWIGGHTILTGALLWSSAHSGTVTKLPYARASVKFNARWRVAAVGSHLRGNISDRRAISLVQHTRGGGIPSLYSFEPYQRHRSKYDDDRRSGCVSRRCVFSSSRLCITPAQTHIHTVVYSNCTAVLKESKVGGHLSEYLKYVAILMCRYSSYRLCLK